MRLRSWRAGTWSRRSRSATRWRGFAALAVAAVVLAACGNPDAPQEYLTPSGPIAEQIDGLWNIVFAVAVFVFVVVEGLLLLLLLRYRARPHDTRIPKQVEGNTRLEVLWTLIPALILAGIAVPTVQQIFVLSDIPDDAMEIRVIGKQYWWEFEYPEQGVVTANEMYIPVGRRIHVVMESFGTATDINEPPGVIHSFWVPKLAGKQDVVPGHVRELQLEADEPGTYLGQCAEFCGLSHANMRFSVVAVEQAEFDQWVQTHTSPAPEPTDADAQRGYELFQERTCIACHAIEGYEGTDGATAEARTGPDLTQLMERKKFAGYTFDLTEENLKLWIASPQEMKPGAQMPDLNVPPEEIDDLVAYLRTLGTPSEAE